MRRTIRLCAIVLVIRPEALAAQDAWAPLIERLTGPSSRLEADLRVLTDEIGGRVTGSPGYERALRWGVDGFRRARVDSVTLETYPVSARCERASIVSEVTPFPRLGNSRIAEAYQIFASRLFWQQIHLVF